MPQRTIWAAVTLLAIGSVVASSEVAAGEGAGALDGRSFAVEVTDPSGDTTTDTLVFENGLFRSVEGEESGFDPVTYSTQFEWEDGLEFSAVARSPDEGTRRWYGLLEGGLIQGTYVWEKAGQGSGDHIFEGSEREGS